MEVATRSERWVLHQAKHTSAWMPYMYLAAGLMSGLRAMLGGHPWSAFMSGLFMAAALASWERLGCRRLLERHGVDLEDDMTQLHLTGRAGR